MTPSRSPDSSGFPVHALRAILPALVLAAAAPAQAIRPIELPELGVSISVPTCMRVTPRRLGSASAGKTAVIEPASNDCFVRGPQSVQMAWDIHVRRDDGGTAEKLLAKLELEWERGRGRLTHRIARHVQALPGGGSMVQHFAVYELEKGDELLVQVRMPSARDKLASGDLRTVRRILASIREIEVEGRDEQLAEGIADVEFANTPERRAALEAAVRNIEGLPGWDLIPTEDYIVLYSWNREKQQGQGAAKGYAEALVKRLSRCREHYEERFPPPVGFVMPWSVLRICGDYEDFRRYSKGAPNGVVGWYSRASKELVLFRDADDVMKSMDSEDVLYHEGYHQYSDARFGASPHPWLEEGTADYFAAHRPGRRRWVFRGMDGRAQMLRAMRAAEPDRLFPFDTFLPGERIPMQRGAEYYAQSYGLIHFLQQGQGSDGWRQEWDGIVDRYLAVLVDTKDRQKAYAQTFGALELVHLEAAFHRWIERGLK